MVTQWSKEEIIEKLKSFEDDPTLITTDSYTPNSDWPNNRIPFVERHLAYLVAHKTVEADHYLSNLELMIKKR